MDGYIWWSTWIVGCGVILSPSALMMGERSQSTIDISFLSTTTNLLPQQVSIFFLFFCNFLHKNTQFLYFIKVVMTHAVALTVLGRVQIQRVVFIMYLAGQLSWMTSRFSNMARHGEFGNITLIQQLESIEDIFIIKRRRRRRRRRSYTCFLFFFFLNKCII